MPISTSPIVIIDDDVDDLELFKSAYEELNFENELVAFNSVSGFLQYLTSSPAVPFLIVSDYNMPQASGIQLRQKLNSDPDLRYKSIPFVIWTTVANKEQVRAAYDNLVQGFFEKPLEFEKLKIQLNYLINYWLFSHHPNSYS